MRDCVIDASVVVKWYLTDEEAADQAASLLITFKQGDFRLAAPSLIEYEVARAIHRGYRRSGWESCLRGRYERLGYCRRLRLRTSM